MPTKKISPIEEHFEKGLLGIAVLILLYILFAYAISSPTSVELGTSTVKPGQASALIRERADQLDATAKQRESDWPEIKLPDSGTKEDTKSSLAALPEACLKPLVPVAMPNKELGDLPATPNPIVKGKYKLPKVLAVTKLATASGRSTVNLAGETDLQELLNAEGDQADVSWVTVAGEIDLEKQRLELAKLPEKIEKEPMFIRVDLQRALVDDKGKVVGEWQDVQFIDPNGLVIASDDSLKVESMEDLRGLRNEVFSQLNQVEGVALMSEFPNVVYGTEWNPPLLPGEKKPVVNTPEKPREKKPTGNQPVRRTPAARRGGGGMEGGPGMGGMGGGGRGGRTARRGGGGAGGMGGMPGGGAMPGGGGRAGRTTRRGAGGPAGGAEMPMMDPGMMGPGMMGPGMAPGMMPGEMGPGGRGGMGMGQQPRQATVQKLTNEERKSEKKLKIWAIDLFGTPGKTYKYRMRVVMYNPLAGYKIYLEDPSNTLLAGIAGPWTEVSTPVRLENEFYYFADALGNDKKSVKFTVIKWHSGNLYSDSFMVKEGEAIGAKKKVKMLPTQVGQQMDELDPEELDFNTGLILAEFSAGEADREVNVTIKTSDGQTLKQNSVQVKDSPDYKKSQEMLKDQRIRISQWKKQMKEMAAQ